MRTLVLLAAFAVVMGVSARNVAVSDTVASVKDAKSVIITEGAGGVKVEIRGTDANDSYVYSYKQEAKPDTKIKVTQDWNLRLPFTKSDTTSVRSKKKRSKWAVISGGLYVGFNSAVDDNPELGVKMGSSVEIAWDRILGLQYRPFAKGPELSVGFGVGWKNYRIKDSFNCFMGDKDEIYVGKFDEWVIPKYSRLKVFSLRVPFMIRQNLGSDFAISAGMVMNINTHASVKNNYLLENGTKVEETLSGVPVRKVSWDVMGVLSYKCLGLSVKYSPQNIFKSGKGLEFKSFSVGIGLFM